VAVKIKLMRLGKIRQPYYRVVVADARTRRSGGPTAPTARFCGTTASSPAIAQHNERVAPACCGRCSAGETCEPDAWGHAPYFPPSQ
jgi:hypothetical protein